MQKLGARQAASFGEGKPQARNRKPAGAMDSVLPLEQDFPVLLARARSADSLQICEVVHISEISFPIRAVRQPPKPSP